MELLLKVEGAEWGYDEDRGVYPWRPVEDADGDGEFEVYPWAGPRRSLGMSGW